MAGTYILGETKVRPGGYFNIQKKGENKGVGIPDGIVGALFKANSGPLNQVVEIQPDENYKEIFGEDMTTDVIAQAFAGGAKSLVCCRIGSAGKEASVKIQTDAAADAVTISSKYVGERKFAVTIRDNLADATKKECIFYSGEQELEKVKFLKGGDEAEALVTALRFSNYFDAAKKEGATGTLAAISQKELEGGTNPTTTVDSYNTGLSALETAYCNVICVDTEEIAVHELLYQYLNRIFDEGLLRMGVVAEKHTVEFEDRISHALSYNDNKMHYVINSAVSTAASELEGYQVAAMIAGMIASYPSNKSLTHKILPGVVKINEALRPTQIITAEKNGCIVLSNNSKSQIWIDKGINTLVAPPENMDDGWKKIRRTKTRFELLKRINDESEIMSGEIDNDIPGRAAMVSRLQAIGTAMVEEGKLTSFKISESTKYLSDGDFVYFDLDIIDKDSAEHIYSMFRFQFSTKEGK